MSDFNVFISKHDKFYHFISCDDITESHIKVDILLAKHRNRLAHYCVGETVNKNFQPEPENESVDHPSHYQGNGIEVIDVIRAFDLNFSLGNAVKYILRAGKKGDAIEDLRKAIWYLNEEIEHIEKG